MIFEKFKDEQFLSTMDQKLLAEVLQKAIFKQDKTMIRFLVENLKTDLSKNVDGNFRTTFLIHALSVDIAFER
jgi:hypothetical protein